MARKFATDASRDPLDLHPQTRDKLLSLLAALIPLGYGIRLLDTARSPESQARLYAKGRTEPGQKVTWAGPDDTYHTKRRAFDFALLTPSLSLDWEWMDSPQALSRWGQIAELAEKAGLSWGGRWPEKKKDLPHFEDRFCAACGVDHKAKEFDFDGECRKPAAAPKEEQP